jgi:8-oxo-dGTP pyrophosphatase MutT (NUDIX family)
VLQSPGCDANSPPGESSSGISGAVRCWRRSGRRGKPEGTWALPKGLIGPGERAELSALREVAEETGVEATPVEKLGDIRYVYTWAGERVFKVVSFFLFRYRSGRLGDIPPEHAHEVAEVRWLPLEEAPGLLAYKGEQEMAAKALERFSVRLPKRERA